MFEKYCIDTLRFLKADKDKYYEIGFVLSQLGIDTSLAGAVKQELNDKGFLTCHKQGCWINDKGIAYLAKIDLGDNDNLKIQQPFINTGTIFHNSPIAQSSLSFNQDNSLDKQKRTNIIPTKPPKRSVLEILSWIVAISAGLIAIYEFLIKKFLLNH